MNENIEQNPEEKGKTILRIAQAANTRVPRFVEVQRNNIDYIGWGDNNLLPQYLIELFDRSGLHNAIVTGKVNDIYGKGFSLREGVTDPRVKRLMESFNSIDSMNEVAFQAINTLEVFNGIALEIIWSVDKKTFTTKHLEMANIRSNIDNSKFYYATDWKAWASPKEMVEYKPFNPEYGPREGSELLFYRVYRPGNRTYPKPDYAGILPQIETNIEVANFHRNNISNGFQGGFLITFIGAVPTREEQKYFREQFQYQKNGTDEAGGVTVIWAPDKDHVPTITPIVPSDNDKQFDILNKNTLTDIFAGHKVVSPMLFGIRTEGQLGGRNELVDAHRVFAVRYRNPRAQIIEKIFNYLIEIQTGVKDSVFLEPIVLFEAPKDATQATNPSTTAVNPAPAVAKLSKEFSEQDVFNVFSRYGRSADEIFITNSQPVPHDATNDNLNAMELSFAEGDIPQLTDDHRKIMTLLNDKPALSNKEIAKQTDLNVATVGKLIEEMVGNGFIKVDNGGNRNLTPIGRQVVDAGDNPQTDNNIYYKYQLRPDAPQLLPGGESRPFCDYMVKQNRAYTRADINLMSAELSRDIWRLRGGWYHNPKTDVNEPACRHDWYQVRGVVYKPR